MPMFLRQGDVIEKGELYQKLEKRDADKKLQWSEYRFFDPASPEKVIGRHIEEFHANGNLKLVVDLDMKKGINKEMNYYPNGLRKECVEQTIPPEEVKFDFHGPQKTWDMNGVLQMSEVFHNGRRMSCELFNETTGQLTSYEEFEVSGEPVLLDVFYPNGSLHTRTYYSENIPVMTIRFDESGTMCGDLEPNDDGMKAVSFTQQWRMELEIDMARNHGAEGLAMVRREAFALKQEN